MLRISRAIREDIIEPCGKLSPAYTNSQKQICTSLSKAVIVVQWPLNLSSISLDTLHSAARKYGPHAVHGFVKFC